MSPIRRSVPTPDGIKPGILVPITTAQEVPSTYLLEDGTTITMRSVVLEIVRVDGSFDPEGNPVYVIKSQNICNVDSPDNLRRKG